MGWILRIMGKVAKSVLWFVVKAVVGTVVFLVRLWWWAWWLASGRWGDEDERACQVQYPDWWSGGSMG